MSPINNHPLSALRLQLLANGYSVLPGLDKACRVKGWNSDFLRRQIKRHGSYEAAIVAWDTDRRDYKTTNLKVENRLLPIDSDIDDPNLAGQFAAILLDVVPEVSLRAPVRFGSGTYKCAYFSRLADGEEPFRRIGSRKYALPEDLAVWRSELDAARVAGRPPDKALKPEYHHVEVFGGGLTRQGHCSRQFGVYGPHTRAAGPGEEGVEYSWAEGPTLEDTPLHALPTVRLRQVWEIVGRFEKAAEACGFEAMEEVGSAGDGGWVFDIDRETTRFLTIDHGTVSYAELEALVETEGDVRCIFSDMVTERPDRCSATWSERYACAMVTDWKTDTWHVPAELAPVDTDLTPYAKEFEGLRKLREKVPQRTVEVTDFYAYVVDHKYLHITSRGLWPVASINAVLGKVNGIKASTWLDRNRRINHLTWAPGENEIIVGRAMREGGWIASPGTLTFNMYTPPARGFVAGDISVWRDHLVRIYPDEAGEIERWLAFKAQHPGEKINHALGMGGAQGIGKDTILEGLRWAVGNWNMAEVNPIQLMGRFNGFLRSVVMRISEVRDRGETDRYAFYNHTKAMIAAPPDTLMVDEKNMKEYRIPNVSGVILTLNEKQSLYLPPDDRRHFIAWSDAKIGDFEEGYFNRIYAWYAAGGLDAVAHHLMTLDISAFDAKAPPRKTRAFKEIVAMSRATEDADMSDALEALGRPAAVTKEDIMSVSTGNAPFFMYLQNPGNNRKVPHRFEECGYTAMDNPDAVSGKWFVGGSKQVIYARQDLSHGERLTAAHERAARPAKPAV